MSRSARRCGGTMAAWSPPSPSAGPAPGSPRRESRSWSRPSATRRPACPNDSAGRRRPHSRTRGVPPPSLTPSRGPHVPLDARHPDARAPRSADGGVPVTGVAERASERDARHRGRRVALRGDDAALRPARHAERRLPASRWSRWPARSRRRPATQLVAELDSLGATHLRLPGGQRRGGDSGGGPAARLRHRHLVHGGDQELLTAAIGGHGVAPRDPATATATARSWAALPPAPRSCPTR